MSTAQYHPCAVSTLIPYPLTLWNYSSRAVLFGSAAALMFFYSSFHGLWFNHLEFGCLISSSTTNSFFPFLLSPSWPISWLLCIWMYRAIHADVYLENPDFGKSGLVCTNSILTFSNETFTIHVRQVQQLEVCWDLCWAIGCCAETWIPCGLYWLYQHIFLPRFCEISGKVPFRKESC